MRLVLVATAFCLVGASVTTSHAQDVQTPHSALEVASATTEATQPFRSHQGLLGKRYFSAEYGRIDYGELDGTGNTFVFNGADLMANLPIRLTANMDSPVGIDAFAGFSRYKLSSVDALDSTLGAFEIGSSIYLNLNRVRPFAQVGVSFLDIQVRTTSLTRNLAFAEDDVGLLLKVGSEVDLCSRAALRFWLDINSKIFDEQGLHTELYFWPIERVFLRGGVGTGLNSDGNTLNVGGGFTF